MGSLFSSSGGRSARQHRQTASGNGAAGRAPASAAAAPPALAHSGTVATIAVHPGQLTIASAGQDKDIQLVDGARCIPVARLRGHSGTVTQISYADTAAEAWLVSGSRDRTVRLWRDREAAAVLEGHDVAITGVEWSADRSVVMSGSRDGVCKFWDAQTGQCLRSEQISRNVVTRLRRMPGSKLIVQSSEDKMLRVWDTESRRPATTFPAQQYIHTCCDVSSDGNLIVTSSNGFSGQGCFATVWDRRQGKKALDIVGHQQSVLACAFWEAGNQLYVATGSNDSTARLWAASDGRGVAQHASRHGGVTSLAPAGDRVYCGTANGAVLVLDSSLQLAKTY